MPPEKGDGGVPGPISSCPGLLIPTLTGQLWQALADQLLSKFIRGPDIYPASLTLLLFTKHGRLPWQPLTAPDILEWFRRWEQTPHWGSVLQGKELAASSHPVTSWFLPAAG